MDDLNQTPAEPLSRRELLKALAAAGGVLGARAIVPTQWMKPQIESGNLPPHAQTTRQQPIPPTPTPISEPQ